MLTILLGLLFTYIHTKIRKKMNKITILFAIMASVVLASCASIQSGTTQAIKISSNPEGATVYTAKIKDGVILQKSEAGVTGATPVKVLIARKDGVIILEKEGYESTRVDLKTTMNPWVWGDVILTSLLSTSIDTSTGAATEYDPDEYMVDLKPVSE